MLLNIHIYHILTNFNHFEVIIKCKYKLMMIKINENYTEKYLFIHFRIGIQIVRISKFKI